MIYEMKLQDKYFNMIKEGIKIYEGRLNDEKRQLIKVGDVIIFKNQSNANQIINVEVKDLIYFNSFFEMANTLPLAKVGFKNKSPNEVSEIYHEFYSVEDEKKFGVVAIKVQNIK